MIKNEAIVKKTLAERAAKKRSYSRRVVQHLERIEGLLAEMNEAIKAFKLAPQPEKACAGKCHKRPEAVERERLYDCVPPSPEGRVPLALDKRVHQACRTLGVEPVDLARLGRIAERLVAQTGRIAEHLVQTVRRVERTGRCSETER